ncbi:MAG: hypothetical protein DRR16_02420 [Candidatus Parabeggiatoa sp. nov. 3]|nr:MAG: hypothetical protein DRR00_06915 [Gammaproteobacteria bacterium]RKZ64666.1 MAG: hypothetical protein DRQ99_15125 [Gammaproteobacteria bacterium]RKZ89458.1 MAG: hypothetical protein DRR16_02420 [Gammaproteobacteria bacterium]
MPMCSIYQLIRVQLINSLPQFLRAKTGTKKSIMNVQFNFEGLENNIPTHFTFHLTRFFKKTCSKEKR